MYSWLDHPTVQSDVDTVLFRVSLYCWDFYIRFLLCLLIELVNGRHSMVLEYKNRRWGLNDWKKSHLHPLQLIWPPYVRYFNENSVFKLDGVGILKVEVGCMAGKRGVVVFKSKFSVQFSVGWVFFNQNDPSECQILAPVPKSGEITTIFRVPNSGTAQFLHRISISVFCWACWLSW